MACTRIVTGAWMLITVVRIASGQRATAVAAPFRLGSGAFGSLLSSLPLEVLEPAEVLPPLRTPPSLAVLRDSYALPPLAERPSFVLPPLEGHTIPKDT